MRRQRTASAVKAWKSSQKGRACLHRSHWERFELYSKLIAKSVCIYSSRAVWGIGVVLFMVLYGRHPFSRPEDASLTAAQQVGGRRLCGAGGSAAGRELGPHCRSCH